MAAGLPPRLPVLHQGPDWLAVHKPSGLHTHPSALSPGEDSAARWLAQQVGRRVWPADDTGGWADEGVIHRPLADRDPENPSGVLREALTRWRSLARVEAPLASGSGEHAFPTTRISLLECRPETGRMHQIRRHLAGIGHPLLGDGEHGSRPLNRILAREMGLERLALCCVELVVDQDGRDPVRLATVLDPDLRRVLGALGLPDPTAGEAGPELFDGVLRAPGKGWRRRAERRSLLAEGRGGAGRPQRPCTPDPDQVEAPCVLCGDPALPYHTEGGRAWRSCPACGLVQLDPACWPSREARDERLRLHRNDPEDAGYRDWLRPLAQALARRLPRGARGVDLGCGPTPVLAGLLGEAGLEARGWDPLFHPRPAPEPEQDWLSACEVFEHLEDPAATLGLWRSWLRPGGWLALSTSLLERDGHFPGWGYARDPAHLVVARPSTLAWLADGRGWSVEREGRVILLRRMD